ncbi:MAG: hypothetical protein RI973_1201 [Bacteroidota bacterium]|jgi:gliding motility-associated-like protein
MMLLLVAGIATAGFSQPTPCGPDPDMSSICATACVICDIDGYTGINSDPEQGQFPPGFCTSTAHHMQWIAFIAGSPDLTITVKPTNCNNGSGLEVGIYESFNCLNFNLVSNCDGEILQGETGVFTNTESLVVGQYYYFVMDGNNNDVCNYIISVTEGTTEVPPLPPVAPIAGPVEICQFDTADFSIPAITGANFYHWTLDGVFAGEGTSVEIAFPDAGLHQVCATAFNVCDTATPSCILVEVHPPVDTSISQAICQGDCFEVADTLLCDPGDYTFLLTSFQGCDSTINVSLGVLPEVTSDIAAYICDTDSLYVGDSWYFPPGQYQELQTSYNGCDSVIHLTLNAIVCEITGNTAIQAVFCHGDETGELTFSVLNGTPPFSYTWERLGGNPSGSGDLPALNLPETISGLPPGTYLVTVKDTFGNDVVLTSVISEPLPISVAWGSSDYNGYEVACRGGQNGVLTALPEGGTPGYSYLWSNGATGASISGLAAGNYALTVTDSLGCTATFETALGEPAALGLTALFQSPGCEGYDSGSAAVVGAAGGVGPYVFSLDGGVFTSDSVYTGLTAGNHTLTVQDANGCKADTTGYLEGIDIPYLELGDEISLLLGNSQLLQVALNLVPQSLVWTPASGLSCTDCLEPLASPVATTQYLLTVTSADGCTATDSLLLRVIPVRDFYVPSAFSPNGDGINDFLTVFGGRALWKIRDLKIFSRWGELVFERADFSPNEPSLGWDGSFRGKPLQPGVFVWWAELEFIDGEVIQEKGDVTLMK